MKTPFLYNPSPVKTDVTPVLARGPYNVYVGAIDEDKLPMYVIVNRDTGVVEATNEILGYIEDWLNHFVKEDLTNNKDSGQLNLNLNS